MRFYWSTLCIDANSNFNEKSFMITKRINIITFKNKLPEKKIERLNPSRSKNSAMITRKKKKISIFIAINFRAQLDQKFQKRNAISKIFNYIKIEGRMLSPQMNRKINHLHIHWNETRWQNKMHLNHFRKLLIMKLSIINASTQYLRNPLSINTKNMIFEMNYITRMKSIRFVILIIRSNIFLISIRTTQPRLLNFEMIKKILMLFYDTCIISRFLCLARPKRHLTMCIEWQYLILIQMIEELKNLTNIRNNQ